MPIQKIPIQQFLQLGKTIPMLDVRSPSEYAYAHIPGAYSYPIFDDEQRKEIGTTYKQVSREEAIKIGLKFFGPNMLLFIEKAEAILKERKQENKTLLVHCWRGGMRSGAMAWLLSFYGFDVYLLEGGYKTYRHWVLQQLDLPFNFIALGGYTGSGKTEVLHELTKHGQSVIDLEHIASHKGSAFGSMGLAPQPSQEYFENILVQALLPFYQMDANNSFIQEMPIWIENESRRIGLINLTEQFYNQLQQAKLFALAIPFEERLKFIVTGYGKFDKEKLVNAIIRIQKRLGGLDTKNAINFLLENDIHACFHILLSYYDKQYKQSMEKSNRPIHHIPADTVDAFSKCNTGTSNLTTMIQMTEPIKLSQYAKGAGCGCKIAPAVLEQILASTRTTGNPQHLLVGNNNNDDAAVYDLQNGTALIVTTDFFMPIVDDAYTFGQAAAANAISDVYAMGGKPITAIAILGWPIDKIPAEVAARVLEGAKAICAEASIVISGGHTIDSPEPFFGLSVNGLAPIENIKQNNTAQLGDIILLTKPIGVGILATAQKRGKLLPEHESILTKQLIQLNTFGEILGKEKGVTAMTDVTGFGLLGHLIEMCEGSNLSAEINYAAIPKLESAIHYAQQFIIPDATYRNWNAYSEKVSIAPTVDATESFALLPDPQTNGGLLITIAPTMLNDIMLLAKQQSIPITQIGQIVHKQEKIIFVN